MPILSIVITAINWTMIILGLSRFTRRVTKENLRSRLNIFSALALIESLIAVGVYLTDTKTNLDVASKIASTSILIVGLEILLLNIRLAGNTMDKKLSKKIDESNKNKKGEE